MNPPAPIKKRGAGRPPHGELDLYKDSILEAAAQVFIERGYEKTSTAEIARRAGASKGTLYSLYPSKEALYVAILRQRVAGAVQPVSDPEHEDLPVADMLENFGRAVLCWMSSAEGQSLYRLIVAAAEDHPELGAACWENGPGRGTALLKQYLDTTVERGLLTIEDTSLAASHFLSMVTGMPILRGSLRLSQFEGAEDAMNRWIQGAVQMFVCAYRSKELTPR